MNSIKHFNTILFSPLDVLDNLRPDVEGKVLTGSIYFAFLSGMISSLILLRLTTISIFVGLSLTIFICIMAALFFILRIIIKSAILSLFIVHTKNVKIMGSDIFTLYTSSFSPYIFLPLVLIIGVALDSNVLFIVAYFLIWASSIYLRYQYYQKLQSYLRINPGLSVFIPVVVEMIYLGLFSLLIWGFLFLMAGIGMSQIMDYLQSFIPM